MQKQGGFTLIELVITIIVLGILAVVAAPKFLNMQDDARLAAAQGVKSALQSSSQLVYSKAAIKGVESVPSASISIANDTVNTKFGYPANDSVAKTVTLDGWSEVPGAAGTFKPDSASNTKCSVVYNNNLTATGGVPEIKVSDTCGK
jgi:MSHA pilin protein MshA